MSSGINTTFESADYGEKTAAVMKCVSSNTGVSKISLFKRYGSFGLADSGLWTKSGVNYLCFDIKTAFADSIQIGFNSTLHDVDFTSAYCIESNAYYSADVIPGDWTSVKIDMSSVVLKGTNWWTGGNPTQVMPENTVNGIFFLLSAGDTVYLNDIHFEIDPSKAYSSAETKREISMCAADVCDGFKTYAPDTFSANGGSIASDSGENALKIDGAASDTVVSLEQKIGPFNLNDSALFTKRGSNILSFDVKTAAASQIQAGLGCKSYNVVSWESNHLNANQTNYYTKSVTPGEWTSVNIDLADLVPVTSTSDVIDFRTANIINFVIPGGETVYLKNVKLTVSLVSETEIQSLVNVTNQTTSLSDVCYLILASYDGDEMADIQIKAIEKTLPLGFKTSSITTALNESYTYKSYLVNNLDDIISLTPVLSYSNQ